HPPLRHTPPAGHGSSAARPPPSAPPSAPWRAAPARPTAHRSNPTDNAARGRGTSSLARRNWHSAPQQDRQASRPLAAGKLRHLPATRGSLAVSGATLSVTRSLRSRPACPICCIALLCASHPEPLPL